jgi:acyl-CoA reductase-like NAD-dependent aldehyde dehydrogenase
MPETLRCISPGDGRMFVERPLASEAQIAQALAQAKTAQTGWANVKLPERLAVIERFVAWFEAHRDVVAEEITRQMGRPIGHTPWEIRGLAERARYMASIAEETLRDLVPEPKAGFKRFIRREPVGVAFVISPWNYPLLTAVNAVVPAAIAGNAVILKHSPQTPLCAERFAEAFAAAGLPAGVFQFLHLSDAAASRLIAAPEVDFVAFTGSVGVGRLVQRAAANRFIGVGLELGGKDPAYVRADADLDRAVENLVDGAFFNAGQSCCAIERIYVDARISGQFIDGFVALTEKYLLGDPLEGSTTLGPVVRQSAARRVREQVAEAIGLGARALVDERRFPRSEPRSDPGSNPESLYLAPQVLVDVTHDMRLMTEETFGPAVGIEVVANDGEAIERMNDSCYGLTASIWTRDTAAAAALGERVEAGTIFMNRCDYLDPALAWTGVKDSGHGCTLSRLGFDAFTRPKSFHLRTEW